MAGVSEDGPEVVKGGVGKQPVADDQVVEGAQPVVCVVLWQQAGIEDDDDRTHQDHHQRHKRLVRR